jgi:hypothetical protein
MKVRKTDDLYEGEIKKTQGCQFKRESLTSFVGLIIITVLPSLSRKLALYIFPVSASTETLG